MIFVDPAMVTACRDGPQSGYHVLALLTRFLPSSGALECTGVEITNPFRALFLHIDNT